MWRGLYTLGKCDSLAEGAWWPAGRHRHSPRPWVWPYHRPVNRSIELHLLRTALTRLTDAETDMDGPPREISVTRYLDPEQLRRERRTVFRKLPVVVGFASQVESPGDYLTHEASGVPVVVTRAADGAVRAFINACRHRGTRLVDGPCGRGARAFVCPYHAWAYDLHGRLRHMPGPYGFAGIDPETRGLVELQVDVRGGLVFVVPTPGVRVPIDDFLGPFADDLGSWGFDQHVAYEHRTRDLQANWKLLSDGSFEVYHVRHAHRKTIYPLFTDNVGVVSDWHEPHVRLIFPKRTLAGLADEPESEWSLRAHANVLYGIFPNTILLVQPDHAMVVTSWPESPDRSTLRSAMLIPEPPTSDRARRYWDKNAELFWTAIDEDLALGERIQQTLDSGANETLLFASYEHLVPKWHASLDRRVAELASEQA